MNDPIPSRAEPVPSSPPPDTPCDPRMDVALALRHEVMQLSARLDYFMRHELAEMRAKATCFTLLRHLSACRAADRTAKR
ncbi:MAG: hypothetical protein H7306_19940 [Bacteriovorax sp.]|nr:hypothetical protein [Rhizobacter sp.]